MLPHVMQSEHPSLVQGVRAIVKTCLKLPLLLQEAPEHEQNGVHGAQDAPGDPAAAEPTMRVCIGRKPSLEISSLLCCTCWRPSEICLLIFPVVIQDRAGSSVLHLAAGVLARL